MGIAKQPGGGMAKHLVGEMMVAVGTFTNRVVAPLALVALTANDGERHHHPVPHLQPLDLGADFHDLAHELMSHDIAVLHARHETVEQMQIRAADGTGSHFDNSVPLVCNDRVRNSVIADILLAVPTQCSQQPLLLLTTLNHPTPSGASCT